MPDIYQTWQNQSSARSEKRTTPPKLQGHYNSLPDDMGDKMIVWISHWDGQSQPATLIDILDSPDENFGYAINTG
jgi:hypothetical protein